jgi:UDP-4-amino-4,6-dideoxy-N-acetyl-beta-L-altrosamine N-acetyltransferase
MAEVSFRDLNESDRDNLFHWRNSPEVSRYMYHNEEIPRANHDRWFSNALNDTNRKYWIIQVDGTPVGLLNLYDIDLKNRKAGWAYYIGDTSKRGHGFSKRCDDFIKNYAFETLGLHKLTCEVLEFNEAVCRIHERNGFRREGVLMDHIKRDDGFHNVVVFGLVAPAAT